MSQSNPANVQEMRITEANRVPMSLPLQKLSVPDIPGWHLHWHLGKNVPQAIRSGYQFVDLDEVEINNTGVATGAEINGSTDLGSRVSVIAGSDLDAASQPERLYLMKLPQEWWESDTAKLGEVNERTAQQLRTGAVGMDGSVDNAKKYLKKGQDLFIPKR